MKPKCTLTAHLKARPENREELVELLTGFIDKARSEPGCIDYHLHVSADDPNVFLFYENWETREDLDRHLDLPYQKEWVKRHDELLVESPKLTFYEMLSERD